MELSKQFLVIFIPLTLLSFGRYFTYVFIATFQDEIGITLDINLAKVLELLEWYQWPNMILSVICGFLMDNLLSLKMSLFIFSCIAMLGHIFFIISFHVKSFWLCAASQLIFGIGYETILIVQVTYCGRKFLHDKIYFTIGILFGVIFGSIFLGKITLRPLFDSIQSSPLLTTTIIITWAHLVSFGCAIWLTFFSDMDGTNPSESYCLQKNFIQKFFIMSLVLVFYYSPNLQFWADFKYTLEMKYHNSGGVIELFFAITSGSMVLFGFLLDRVKKKITFLLGGLVILFLSHILLTFTYITPWPLVIAAGVAHAISQLVIWVFLFFILPKNEYATAMGFLQSFQNMTLAMSGHLKPLIMNNYGLFLQGIINIICMLIAFAAAMFLWYMN